MSVAALGWSSREERWAGGMERRAGSLEELGAKLEAAIDRAVAVKEDLKMELARESLKGYDDPGSPPEASVVLANGVAQPGQTLLAPGKQITSPLEALSALHLDGASREQHMLDAILKNQETLQMVLRNQDLLKSQVDRLQKTIDRLQKTISDVDERLHVMEQETGLLAQLTQELNEVGDEVSWG